MDRAKYVMFDYPGMGEVPILFPSHIEHKEIVRMVQAKSPGITPISAGFVSPKYECFGCSISLDLKPDVRDSAIIKLMFKED